VSGSYGPDAPDPSTVTAYLANRLGATDAEAFEVYCLRHPDFARRVELELILKVGLRQTQGPDPVRRTRNHRRMVLAIAAGLVLVVAGAVLLLPPVHPGELLAYRSATEVPSPLLAGPRVSVTLIRLRAGPDVHQVIAPREAGVLAVRVAPDSSPGRAGYAMGIALESVIPHSVTVDNLLPDANGYIQVYLPLASVAGKSLKISVNPFPSTGSDSISFRVQVQYAPNTPVDAR
jgi:hypothetical protein